MTDLVRRYQWFWWWWGGIGVMTYLVWMADTGRLPVGP